MALSHVKIKWNKPDIPWICRVEYYRPKKTWKRYRGVDTKCEKPNYIIYDPCYALSPIITGTILINLPSKFWQKYQQRKSSGQGACLDQDELYIQLQSTPQTPTVNAPLFQESNRFKTQNDEDIKLIRGKRVWSWYADPTLHIDFDSVVGVRLQIQIYNRNGYTQTTSTLATIRGMGFNMIKSMYCNKSYGICSNNEYITNYNFSCEAGITYDIEIAADDWTIPQNTPYCRSIGSKYFFYKYISVVQPGELLMGEKNTWQGSWDPPLEGEYMLGVKNTSGKFFPLCPIVNSP